MAEPMFTNASNEEDHKLKMTFDWSTFISNKNIATSDKNRNIMTEK